MNKVKAFLLLICIAVLTGCSDDTPPLGSLTGKLMMDGKPFANGSLVFSPDGGGRPSVAISDAEGNFQAYYLKGKPGALPGTHSVSFEPADASGDVSEEEQFMPPASAKRGPKRYSISPSEVKVNEGSNEVVFTLSSK